jgi:hypothetical protein
MVTALSLGYDMIQPPLAGIVTILDREQGIVLPSDLPLHWKAGKEAPRPHAAPSGSFKRGKAGLQPMKCWEPFCKLCACGLMSGEVTHQREAIDR